jgi:hypothetical protein
MFSTAVRLLCIALSVASGNIATNPRERIDNCGGQPLPYGAFITLSGQGYLTFGLHDLTEFDIDASWSNGTSISDAQFQVRVVGPALVAGRVVHRGSRYVASYQTHDPGDYMLELRVSWLSGSTFHNQPLPLFVPEFLNKSIHVDCILYRGKLTSLHGALAKSANKAKRKKYSSRGMNRLLNRQSIGKVADADADADAEKPLCKDGSSAGRWIWIPPGESCPPSVCVGSASSLAFLEDLVGFNTRWVWSPYDCNYRIFSLPEFEQCLVNKSINAIAFNGDSLLREHFQNMHVFLQMHLPNEQKRWTSKANNQLVEVQLPGGHRVQLDYWLDLNARTAKIESDRVINGLLYRKGVYDSMIFNTHMLRTLVSQTQTDNIDYFMGSLVDERYGVISGKRTKSHLEGLKARKAVQGNPSSSVNERAAARGGGSNSSMSIAGRAAAINSTSVPAAPNIRHQTEDHMLVYYLHPRIQREDVRISREELKNVSGRRKVEGFACMTPPRQNVATAAILKKLKDLNKKSAASGDGGAVNRIALLDGLQVSEARWEGTWDGAHYSLLLNSQQLLPSATCPRFLLGGRHLCHLKQYPGVNRCRSQSHLNSSGDTTGSHSVSVDKNTTRTNGSGYDRMEWCRNVADRSATFDLFEGGVSRMITMMWMNMICNN